MKVIGAGKFKAQCLALLDEVAREHQTIVVTKHGKPVAQVTPAVEDQTDIETQLKDSILKEKDIVSPLREMWDAAS